MGEATLKADEFRCEMCGKVFPKGWSDQEAIEQQRRNFNEEPKEDDAIVCDDCYKLFISKVFN